LGRCRARTHLNASVRWTLVRRWSRQRRHLNFCPSHARAKMQIEPDQRHHIPTLTLIESGWDFSFTYLTNCPFFRSFRNKSRENSFLIPKSV